MTVLDKTLLVVDVFLSNSRPHYLRAEGPETGVYARLGSTNRQADRELITELRRSVEGIAFDELPMPALTQDDLDLAALKALFRDTHDLDEKELLTLRLLKKEQGRLVPTKGAMLICGKERTRYFPDAWMQCGRFIGHDKARIFDHIDLHDHLPQAVENIMLFLKKHAMRGADFSEIRRRDVWSIPLGILREVVINALVHADYSQRGAPIRVAFFDDRIEIKNPGILPPGMTIEDMRQGVSKIRNHVIARVFRELNLIEQWGSGIPRILREAEKLGMPDLQMEELGMRMRVTVFLTEQINIQPVTPEVTPEVMGVLFVMAGDMTRGEIMKTMGLKDEKHFREKYQQTAVKQGLIEMTIPDKPRSSKQRYRITPLGKEILKKAGKDMNGDQ